LIFENNPPPPPCEINRKKRKNKGGKFAKVYRIPVLFGKGAKRKEKEEECV
jgi:hypothetical protein